MGSRKCVGLSGVLILISLAFAACASQATPEAAPTGAGPAPTASQVAQSWDGAYEKVGEDLCPHGVKCEGQLSFDGPVPELYAGKEMRVQHGLYANAQGELFRMNVIGVNDDAVKRYTEHVKVCLDWVFSGEAIPGERPDQGADQLPKDFGVNPDDLIVEVYLEGFLVPEKIGEDVASQVVDYPAQEWAGKLKEMGWTSEQAMLELLKQGYVVDFAIDPGVSNGATHHYPEKYAEKIHADVSVAEGGGSVKARLDRNTEQVDATTLARGEKDTDELSNDNEGHWTSYALAVQGNDSGTYRVSGRRDTPGWRTYEYLGAPPNPDPTPCPSGIFCLRLAPGQSSDKFPIEVITPQMPIPKLDVLLLFDVSYSLSEEIDQVKWNASKIMEMVTQSGLDAAFGVASFLDYPDFYSYAGYENTYGTAGDYPWHLDQDITTDRGRVQDVLNALPLGNGMDLPEAYSLALDNAASLVSWRPETKKIIVLLGDSVPHDPEFFVPQFGTNTGVDPGGDWKAGTGDDLYFEKVVDHLVDQRIEVIPISFSPDYDPALVQYFVDYLAGKTGGKAFTNASAVDAPGAIMAGLEAATVRINDLIISSDPRFEKWVAPDPWSYGDVGGGERLNFDVIITVPQDTQPGTYEFYLIALGDGSKLEERRVVVEVP